MTASIVVMMLFSFFACSKEKTKFDSVKIDYTKMPTMNTDSVSILISDSGVTRYKLVTKKWLSYDRASEPYWFFPKGVFLERFDENYREESTVRADSAWNFRQKALWRLKGNVYIKNVEGDEFKTMELYWDEKNDKIYTDKYIEIKRPMTQLKGYGFESNRELTEYRILRPHDGRIPFSEDPNYTPTPLTPNGTAPSMP